MSGMKKSLGQVAVWGDLRMRSVFKPCLKMIWATATTDTGFKLRLHRRESPPNILIWETEDRQVLVKMDLSIYPEREKACIHTMTSGNTPVQVQVWISEIVPMTLKELE